MTAQAIPERYQGLAVVSPARMRELDRLATERYGVAVGDLMENAGRAVAEATARYLQDDLGADIGKAPIVVCCGRGANGGDGLVAARYLALKGARVRAFLCPPRVEGGYPDYIREGIARAKLSGVAVAQAGPAAGLAEALAQSALVLDALLGTGSAGKPAGDVHQMIVEMLLCGKPILSLDMPSGLDGDTGEHEGVCVKAEATLTLGLAKRGLLAPAAKSFVGKVEVLDIGYPRQLIEEGA